VGKLGVGAWKSGSALGHILTDPQYGAAGLRPVVLPLVENTVTSTIMTLGTLLLEAVLVIGPLVPRRARRYLLVLAIAFHVAIGLVMGLISFAVVMIAALILYLRPLDEPYSMPLASMSEQSSKGVRATGTASRPACS
jgi:antimicrobial peptide system SdpB family protein